MCMCICICICISIVLECVLLVHGRIAFEVDQVCLHVVTVCLTEERLPFSVQLFPELGLIHGLAQVAFFPAHHPLAPLVATLGFSVGRILFVFTFFTFFVFLTSCVSVDVVSPPFIIPIHTRIAIVNSVFGIVFFLFLATLTTDDSVGVVNEVVEFLGNVVTVDVDALHCGFDGLVLFPLLFGEIDFRVLLETLLLDFGLQGLKLGLKVVNAPVKFATLAGDVIRLLHAFEPLVFETLSN
mmetsp:Transcript_1886/g.3784  ORF Transcript_1886/g.3784 Transcript_1886/m.3784 type:complete len:240 (-) Transcript_1886:118-837(-)